MVRASALPVILLLLFHSSFHCTEKRCVAALHYHTTITTFHSKPASTNRLRHHNKDLTVLQNQKRYLDLGETTNNRQRSCNSDWKYEILQTYTYGYDQYEHQQQNNITLPKILHELDPMEFPSVSQARNSCKYGRILIFSRNAPSAIDTGNEIVLAGTNSSLKINTDKFPNLMNHDSRIIVVASSSSKLREGDIIGLRERIEDGLLYPSSTTRYVHPPPYLEIALTSERQKIEVVYEDAYMAIVHKPEYLNTIGDDQRNDLQSCLPFLLRPPPDNNNQRFRSMTNSFQPPIPRPVHRLDRRTSGLVLVSKTNDVLQNLSKDFAERRIEKYYAAIVFGIPPIKIKDPQTYSYWNTIDYPIDGKRSMTLWRIICTFKSSAYNSNFTLLLCKPETGRYHQIRRHLSYCLGTPIVGDNKYDKGRLLAKKFRSLGMFLCSNMIVFQHPIKGWDILDDRTGDMSVTATCKTNIMGNNDLDSDFGMTNPLDITTNSVQFWKCSTAIDGKEQQGTIMFRVNIPLPSKFKTILGL